MSDLAEISAELNKRFGANTIISGDQIAALQLPRVSTGSLSLDIETGGGFPYGRLIEIYGLESSGKSFIAAKIVANAQKSGKKAAWMDIEGAFDPEWASLLGVNVSDLMLARPVSGEQACDILEAFVQSSDCICSESFI